MKAGKVGLVPRLLVARGRRDGSCGFLVRDTQMLSLNHRFGFAGTEC